MVPQSDSSIALQRNVTCPHCWERFAPEDTKWIAVHADLLNDVRLGPEAFQRFLPSRYTVQGNALDARGMECLELACPRCHLRIPRTVLELRSNLLSIAGAPSSGKSFYLAAMAWQLRKVLPQRLYITFSDADGEFNRMINDYEQQLFYERANGSLARLAKTQEAGDWYNLVRFEDQSITFPQPFLFDVRPGLGHPHAAQAQQVARLIGLYDNAGESFQPGKDTAINASTRHLGQAESWIFCFDPTQDPRFRNACAGRSDDHQMLDAPVTARQEAIFFEMLQRIRRHAGLGQDRQTTRPLFVLCTKYDAWHVLLGELLVDAPFRYFSQRDMSALDLPLIRGVSARLRTMLREFQPDIVAAAESFSRHVYYLPVSATGMAPAKDPQTGHYGFLAGKLKPVWCEVPILLALHHQTQGLVPTFDPAVIADSAKKPEPSA